MSQLSPRARPLLRHGPFEVCKQNRVAMCKRCGAQIPKSSVRISYPSTVKSGNTLAVTVQLHVECAVLSCGLRIQSSISYFLKQCVSSRELTCSFLVIPIHIRFIMDFLWSASPSSCDLLFFIFFILEQPTIVRAVGCLYDV